MTPVPATPLPPCDKCKKPLQKMGALVFSPPIYESAAGLTCAKLHICTECWPVVVNFCVTSRPTQDARVEALTKAIQRWVKVSRPKVYLGDPGENADAWEELQAALAKLGVSLEGK